MRERLDRDVLYILGQAAWQLFDVIYAGPWRLHCRATSKTLRSVDVRCRNAFNDAISCSAPTFSASLEAAKAALRTDASATDEDGPGASIA